jgi:lipopolysaccharide/colanic/teichoic acid biosynthesis glycosyltransferase
MSITTTDALETMRIQSGGQRARINRPQGNPISLDLSQGKTFAQRAYPSVKAAVEWFCGLVMFAGLLPLMIVLALAVRLTSKGPAFYSQTRLGKNGRHYRMFKLRSMVHDAEVATGPVWAARDDNRITAVGRILRDTHLDELPQLWNVLRGEMALIGPRPERPELAAGITQRMPEFSRRLSVRPGVTGLAQMLLPADDPTDTELQGLRKKLTHDVYYIEHLSLAMDMRIAFATPCYFIAAAIQALRIKLLATFGQAAEKKALQVRSENESFEEVA